MNKKLLTSICLLNLGVLSTYGQQIVNFTGYGRAQVDNNQFIDKGNGVTSNKADTVGKSTRGYTLFDLGINATPSDNFKASVILRLRNEFGGFFGNGSSFAFRQMKLEGKIAKVVKYEIGDIDLGLTKYTLYNQNDIWNDYESDIFKIRREIVNYENFYNDNKWRLQGINLGTAIKFKKGVEKLGLQVFGTRTRPSNYFTSPDRMLFGGRVELVQGKFGAIGFNNINLQDINTTALNSGFLYKSMNNTIDAKLKADLGKVTVGIDGEFGWSNFQVDTIPTKNNLTNLRVTNDMFYDGSVFVKYNPLGIKLFGGMKQVGVDYYAPGAQSLRVYNTAVAGVNNMSLFPTMNNGTMRNINMYDRFTQESYGGIYNNGISATLLPYFAQYNNATPYGEATANRKGIYAGLEAKDSAGIYDVSVRYDNLKELSAEGGTSGDETRKFSVITAGAKLYINKLIKVKNTIAVNGGARLENTTRSGNNPADLKNQMFDAGLELEAFKSFYILGGYKLATSNGNEYIMGRNAKTNELTSVVAPVKMNDLSQQILSFGAKYNFNKNNVFSAQLNLIENKGQVVYTNDLDLVSKNKYSLTQIYLVYTIRF